MENKNVIGNEKVLRRILSNNNIILMHHKYDEMQEIDFMCNFSYDIIYLEDEQIKAHNSVDTEQEISLEKIYKLSDIEILGEVETGYGYDNKKAIVINGRYYQ